MASFPYRELYCPAHFGNSYEVMASYEMKEALSEAKYWGFNAYGDWFDAADSKDPHNNPRNEYLLPQALLDRKLESFRLAQELGLHTDLVITPNHVYLDQLKPGLLADTSDSRFFGQLLCPSKPEARQTIVDNHRRLFKDLKDRGVSLDSISGCPFDYGGCNCEQCRPWIMTFGKLMAEIHDAAKEYFPGIKVRLIGWWWNKEEHDLFKQWADKPERGRFASLAAHLPYGETRPNPGIVLPEDCELHAFVHIGYADKAQPRDVYGAWGPVAAPNRLATTCYELSGIGCKGFMAYSEGMFDDVNKALLGSLSSGKASDPPAALGEYAARYFGAKGTERKAWAEWLAKWGEPFTVDVKSARREFDRLAKNARPGWRLAQFEAKVRLFEAHHEVLGRKEWDKARMAAAERFILERDKLFREVWRLGPVRQVVNPRFSPPEWYADWKRQPRMRISDEA